MKKLCSAAALGLIIATSAASAEKGGQCELQRVTATFGMMRAKPSLSAEPLWKLGEGAVVSWCGRTSTDSRGIVWNWVGTMWQEERWAHKGWISSRIVERDVPTITLPNENWEPSKKPEFHTTTPANRDQWTDLVNEVIDLSSRQHNGTPLHTRFCEPEFKTCSDVVSYMRLDGLETAAEVHTDAAGAVIDRLVCELNKTQDVRTCVNFDTKEKVTAMKDVHGKWNNIAGQEEGVY